MLIKEIWNNLRRLMQKYLNFPSLTYAKES